MRGIEHQGARLGTVAKAPARADVGFHGLVQVVRPPRWLRRLADLLVVPAPRQQAVQQRREQDLADDGLDGAAADPQFARGVAHRAPRRFSGNVRIENVAHRLVLPAEEIARPVELDRVHARHLQHRHRDPGAPATQFGPQ